ncbi:MAG: hypothetical protein Q4G04_00065 [bacterium]|nr:hypothetical protein [bacterium]
MSNKKIIISLLVVIVVVVVSIAGFSYAWYEADSGKTTVGVNTTANINVNFATSQYISTTTALPIYDSDAATKANKSLFTVATTGSLPHATTYTVSLVDIVIPSALKVSTFKWELIKDEISVASGNFASIGTATTLDLYSSNFAASSTATDSYELRIWLSETCADITNCNTNQNSQMQQTFTAKVQILSILKP